MQSTSLQGSQSFEADFLSEEPDVPLKIRVSPFYENGIYEGMGEGLALLP